MYSKGRAGKLARRKIAASFVLHQSWMNFTTSIKKNRGRGAEERTDNRRQANCFHRARKKNCDVDVSLLGCDAAWICRWLPAFRRNIPIPPSGLLNITTALYLKTIKKAILLLTLLFLIIFTA
jgi:hypothetical protein